MQPSSAQPLVGDQSPFDGNMPQVEIALDVHNLPAVVDLILLVRTRMTPGNVSPPASACAGSTSCMDAVCPEMTYLASLDQGSAGQLAARSARAYDCSAAMPPDQRLTGAAADDDGCCQLTNAPLCAHTLTRRTWTRTQTAQSSCST